MPEKSPRDQAIALILLAARYTEAIQSYEEVREQLFQDLPVLLPAARQAANRMSQEGLADEVGLHATAISKIENGRQVPNLANLGKIALVIAEQALGIPGPTAAATYENELLEAVYLFQQEYGKDGD